MTKPRIQYRLDRLESVFQPVAEEPLRIEVVYVLPDGTERESHVVEVPRDSGYHPNRLRKHPES